MEVEPFVKTLFTPNEIDYSSFETVLKITTCDSL
jgi:hypothetical protein